jgi:hypothetical protein
VVADAAIVIGMEPDGWILQTVNVVIKPLKECKLKIDLTALAGVQQGGQSSILVTGNNSLTTQKTIIKVDELPKRIEILLNESSKVFFENIMSESSRGADVRPLSARGYVSCAYAD